MPRPKKVLRSIQKNVALPEDLVARVELDLWSPAEGKVPFGAWQKFLEGLIREHYALGDGARAGDGDHLEEGA